MGRAVRRMVIALMIACVTVPLVPLVLWSFADVWPFDWLLPAFGTHAWESTLDNRRIVEAFGNSLKLVVVVVPLSLVLSFFAAKELGTRRFGGRRAVQLLLLVPSFVPQISIVFGMQRVFSNIGLYNNFAGVVAALLVFYVPYATLLLSAVFETYDMDYERQAATLGVGRWGVFWHVTLPQVRSGLIVTCIFCFIGVWSAYLVVSAVAPPDFKTLSLVLFPMINSASNGYASTAAATILYIAPILGVVAAFSHLLVGDEGSRSRGGEKGGGAVPDVRNYL